VQAPRPHFTKAVAHDESAPLTTMARRMPVSNTAAPRLVPGRGTSPQDKGFTGDAAVQPRTVTGAPVTFPIETFAGLRNADNFEV